MPAERKNALRRLCISARVLGAGMRSIGPKVVGVTGVLSPGVCGMYGVCGVGGSEGRSDAPEKVRRPSAGSYMATNVRAV